MTWIVFKSFFVCETWLVYTHQSSAKAPCLTLAVGAGSEGEEEQRADPHCRRAVRRKGTAQQNSNEQRNSWRAEEEVYLRAVPRDQSLRPVPRAFSPLPSLPTRCPQGLDGIVAHPNPTAVRPLLLPRYHNDHVTQFPNLFSLMITTFVSS